MDNMHILERISINSTQNLRSCHTVCVIRLCSMRAHPFVYIHVNTSLSFLSFRPLYCEVRNLFHDVRTSFRYSRAGECPSVPETSFPSQTHERSHFKFGHNLSLRAEIQSPSNSTNTLWANLQLMSTGGPRAAGTGKPQEHWQQVSSCRERWWRLPSAKLRADARVQAHQRPTAPITLVSEHPSHIHLPFLSSSYREQWEALTWRTKSRHFALFEG